MSFADLHVHTIFSDGTSTPEELVLEAKKRGLSCIAVVDHDTISGIPLALLAAKEAGLEVIPGIEFTTEEENLEIHILGYFIDYQNKTLLEKLEVLNRNRIERVYKICAKLSNLGITLNPDEVFAMAGRGTISRLHIARAMANAGICGSAGEAFQRFIGDKSPAYVGGFRISPLEAIQLIKNLGGVSVLAHPYILRNDALIPKFVEYGLGGIEVYYPEHSQAMINFYLQEAKKYNLAVTGGSDYHGKAKPDVRLGIIKLPMEFVEDLRKRSLQ